MSHIYFYENLVHFKIQTFNFTFTISFFIQAHIYGRDPFPAAGVRDADAPGGHPATLKLQEHPSPANLQRGPGLLLLRADFPNGGQHSRTHRRHPDHAQVLDHDAPGPEVHQGQVVPRLLVQLCRSLGRVPRHVRL